MSAKYTNGGITKMAALQDQFDPARVFEPPLWGKIVRQEAFTPTARCATRYQVTLTRRGGGPRPTWLLVCAQIAARHHGSKKPGLRKHARKQTPPPAVLLLRRLPLRRQLALRPGPVVSSVPRLQAEDTRLKPLHNDVAMHAASRLSRPLKTGPGAPHRTCLTRPGTWCVVHQSAACSGLCP